MPLSVLVTFLLLLGLKVLTAAQRDEWQANAAALPDPSPLFLSTIGAGDPLPVARLAILWLQSFDNQPGVSLSYSRLDYEKLADWLTQILQLEPRGQYPLLLASRIYGEVNHPERRRIMADLVYQQYQQDPGRRWRWLAHTITVVRHRLKDMPLALEYAHALSSAPADLPIPGWARQMEIFLREDMGETEVAAVMLGALIDSGAVQDPAEMRFLLERLEKLRSD